MLYVRTNLVIYISFMISLGNLLDEYEVLEWMMDQKNDNSIEEINREKLFEYIDSKEFLAVVFCKYAKYVSFELRNIFFIKKINYL